MPHLTARRESLSACSRRCNTHRLAVVSGAVAGLLVCASSASAQGDVTFTRDVAPILQERCQTCHRAGQMAPMSLVTYDEVRPWARAIRAKVVERSMPPWHIDKTIGIQAFQNDISLNRYRDRCDRQLGRRWGPERQSL